MEACFLFAKIEYFHFLRIGVMRNGTLFRFDVYAKMRRPCYCVIIIIIKEEKEFVIRVSNLKKSIKARTTGKIKRKIKKSLIPGHGKKGMGWVKDPKRATYNKVYDKTSFSLFDLLK